MALFLPKLSTSYELSILSHYNSASKNLEKYFKNNLDCLVINSIMVSSGNYSCSSIQLHTQNMSFLIHWCSLLWFSEVLLLKLMKMFLESGNYIMWHTHDDIKHQLEVNYSSFVSNSEAWIFGLDSVLDFGCALVVKEGMQPIFFFINTYVWNSKYPLAVVLIIRGRLLELWVGIVWVLDCENGDHR